MIDISRVTLPKDTMYDIYKSDLLNVFSDYTTEETDGNTLIYINDDKSLLIDLSKGSENTPILKFRYGGNSGITSERTIERNPSQANYNYKMVKFDNGVVGFSALGMNNDAEYATNYGMLQYYVLDFNNIVTGESVKAIVRGDDKKDEGCGYTFFTGINTSENLIRFADSNSKPSFSAMTVLAPIYAHTLPLTSDKMWVKLRSQQQFGEIVLSDKKYMSCGTFCVPLE